MRRIQLLCVLAGLLGAAAGLAAQTPGQGRIAGQVVDRETGRPVPDARITVLQLAMVMQTDLDGRYRTAPLPVGRYTVRAVLIGYQPSQVDSVGVEDDKATIVGFALSALAIELSEVVIEATPPPAKASTDAGLLSAQQAAPAVSDGISAQGIARSPDANAGEAVKRVTGVSLFDGKFLICRGLGERWSNALLNGAEMPNPVVEKKIAPLDLFPAGLIASVVAKKTATPDMPGDFAGCSVDLSTKDFPESRILQISLGQSSNDGATFEMVPLPASSGTDFWGIDDGRREPPPIPYGNIPAVAQRQILQGFQDDVWNPAPRHILPGPNFGATYGNQWQGTTNALGALASFTYSDKTAYTPDRLYNVYYLSRQATSNIEWGGIASLSYRLGARHKLGWKNLYTRAADQTSLSGQGADGSVFHRSYQLRYVERYLWQTQLTGEHHVLGSTFSWKGTLGRARIEDPDNHQAEYVTAIELGAGTSVSGRRMWRTLADLTRSGQVDWSVPISLRRPADALFKLGGYYRAKTRDYDGRDLQINRDPLSAPLSGMDGVIETLPPEQVFAPENLGTYFSYVSPQGHNDPFFADDNVGAAYALLDVPVLARVRLVGGVRAEQWHLRLKPGGNDPEGNWLTFGEDSVIKRDNLDPLWSANLTVILSEHMNLRFAAFRSLARPDSREISPGRNTSLAGLGACTEVGNPNLQRSLITNADARWEVFPRPGELLAVSAFYKHFDQPIVELRNTGGFNNPNADCTMANEHWAEVRGAEFEVRKVVGRIGVGLNVTGVISSIKFYPQDGLQARRFIGQSPFVANGYVAYEPPGSRVNVSLLYNYFGDRITTYSNKQGNTGTVSPDPNWVERGRGSVDLKFRFLLKDRLKFTLSGKNLTRSPVVIEEDSGEQRTVAHYNPGVSISSTLTYDF